MTVKGFELSPGMRIGDDALPIIAGPCVIESAEQSLAIAEQVAQMAQRLAAPMIFKASYDKANRSSLDSYRGPGMVAGLEILGQVTARTGLPILTDVHAVAHCEPAAKVCQVLQIPAFLCRQTDLVVAAARTGCVVNLKKGQFMAPDDMLWAVDKVRSTGNERVCVTERGFSFGYHNLVVDMRAFAMMHQDGIPVIYDVTHSLQLPGGGSETGGVRQFAEPLARAAVAAGADGLYLEVHSEPDNALSDKTTQLPPDRAEALLSSTLIIRRSLRVGSPEA